MSQKRDYYQVLGISRDADQGTIKKAYRKLAKKYHPDTNTGNTKAEERFKEVTEAYDILSDAKKRKLYDQFGHEAFEAGAGPKYQEGGGYRGYGYDGPGGSRHTYSYRGPGGGYRSYSYTYDGMGEDYQGHSFEGQDMDDILRQFFGDSFGEQGFHGRGFRNNFQEDFRAKGSDLRAEVTVSFEEAAFGCEKVIQLQNPSDGKRQSLQVHIPAGIETGKSIRLRGKGMPGEGGAQPGDLFLKVTVLEKPGFRRQGMDVYTTVRVPFTTAVLGGEVVVQTLYGKVVCKIREGTQSGTKIRLKGKGIVSMKNPEITGDQYAQVEIQVPQRISPQAKQKLKEFEQACKTSGTGKGSAA